MDIIVKDINKEYDKKPILKDFNAVFYKDMINCIMGASGIGKTTFVNILMGLTNPDSGEVFGMKGKKISVVFQEDRLIEHWDAVENVMMVTDKGITRTMVEEELIKLSLNDIGNKPVSCLSGGMRRRVAIVRALINDNDIIIMDEPFKGLDETLKQQVINYVKKKVKGKIVIIITHDKEEVIGLNARMIVMEEF